jgi:small subunit ribosomal protein S20
MRNRGNKTRVKKLVKEVRIALEGKSPEEAQEALSKAVPVIDKAASKGVLHRRTAARKISRLSKQVHALSDQQD